MQCFARFFHILDEHQKKILLLKNKLTAAAGQKEWLQCIRVHFLCQRKAFAAKSRKVQLGQKLHKLHFKHSAAPTPVHSAQCTVFSAQCTVHSSMQNYVPVLYNVFQCRIFHSSALQYTALECILYTVQCTRFAVYNSLACNGFFSLPTSDVCI